MKKISTIKKNKLLVPLQPFLFARGVPSFDLSPTILTTMPFLLDSSNSLKKSQQKDDIYHQYIDSLKNKKYTYGTCLEKHHILPLHAGGNNCFDNLISISIKDHALAHFYRFLAYKDKNDKLAYLFRKNDNSEAFKVRSQQGLESRRKKGLLKRFKDSEAQALLGKKGGKVAGSLNTLSQTKARQKVGKKYGRIVGKLNQSFLLKKLLTMSQIWEHDCGIRVKTTPCDTFKKICNQLENVVPGKIKNESTLIKVLYGERRKIYGWKLLIMVIRSEVGDGLFDPPKRSETKD